MTTLADAMRRRSCRTPSAWSRSSATDSLVAFNRSKKGPGPRRAPSGRRNDSTLMTLAPAHDSSWPASGPAHSEVRSSTVASSTPKAPAPLRPKSRAPIGRPNSVVVTSETDPSAGNGEPEQHGARIERARRTRRHRGAHHRPWVVRVDLALEPGGKCSDIVGARQADRDPRIGAGDQPGTPPAADGPAACKPADGGTLPEQRQPVNQLTASRVHVERRSGPRHQIHQCRRCAKCRPVRAARQGHGPASRPQCGSPIHSLILPSPPWTANPLH